MGLKMNQSKDGHYIFFGGTKTNRKALSGAELSHF
jgi:hypothetical protein